MLLNLIGLCLNFVGTFILALDTYLSLGKPKSYQIYNYKLGKVDMKLEPEKPWGYKQVKITKEEKLMIGSLFLNTLGFLFQLIALY